MTVLCLGDERKLCWNNYVTGETISHSAKYRGWSIASGKRSLCTELNHKLTSNVMLVVLKPKI